MRNYDVIVLGVGGVGSATLYHLARRGLRVLGIDQFNTGHDRGSSHGETRIIRLAYYEHPDYVPLLLRAYELWHELEINVQKQLLYPVGLLGCAPANGEFFRGILHTAEKHKLCVEQLSAEEVYSRWPGFRLPETFCGLFEACAGYLLVEQCVKAHVECAIQNGAELRCGIHVRGWKKSGQGIVIDTDTETFVADRLVITPGAWATSMLQSLPVAFRVLRKSLFWYPRHDAGYSLDASYPCFFFEAPYGVFYGFPETHNGMGVKVAEHTGGLEIKDPLNVDRSMHINEQQRIETFLNDHLPNLDLQCLNHAVCMYTMSPDGHFVIDQHPNCPQVIFTAGLSGHGFKFTSVLGEILSDLAIDGRTRHPIDFLRMARFP